MIIPILQLAKGFLPLLVRTKTAFDRLFGPIESKEEGGLNDTENNDRGEYLSDSLMKGKRDLLLFLSNCANSFFELLERGLLPIANSEEDITDMAIDDVGLLSTVATLEHFFFDVKRVDSAIGGVGLTSRSAHILGMVGLCSMISCLLVSLLTGLGSSLPPQPSSIHLCAYLLRLSKTIWVVEYMMVLENKYIPVLLLPNI